jgi:hypothetical protein
MIDIKIVINRYHEDLTWIKKYTYDYIVYNKGQACEFETYKTNNIGRESETYLRYIVDNYYNLSDYTMFLQGNPFDHCNTLPYILNNISLYANDSIISLSNDVKIDDINGNPYHKNLPIKPVYDKLFNTDCNNIKLKFGPGAQYIVPKKFIISKTIEWWKDAYTVHTEFSENLNEPKGRGNPAPWIFERLWPIIWQYEI